MVKSAGSHSSCVRVSAEDERQREVCVGKRERASVCVFARERSNLYPRPQQWGVTVTGENNPLVWGGEGGVTESVNTVRRERADRVTQGCPAPPTSKSPDGHHNRVTLNHRESSSPCQTHQHP